MNKIKHQIRVILAIVGIMVIVPFQSFQSYADNSLSFLAGYTQTIFDEDTAIPVPSANHVLQTEDKYIWVASYSGLIRYDGSTSYQFTPSNSGIPTTNINWLYEDENGTLWIGTNDSGVVLYSEGEFVTINTEDGLPSDSIRAMCGDKNGNVYVATAAGFAVINQERGVIVTGGEDADGSIAWSVDCAKNGEVWCVQNDSSVNIIKDNQTVYTYTPEGLNGMRPSFVYADQDSGSVYIGTHDNQVLYFEYPEQRERYRIITLPSDVRGVQTLCKDTDGRLWVGALSGICYLDGLVPVPIGGAGFNTAISAIMQDYEGDYWLTSTRMGLLHLSRNKLYNLSFAAQLPVVSVNSTIIYHDNSYLATDVGLYILDENETTISNELTKFLSDTRIRALMLDSKDNLWLCCYGAPGVVVYNERDGIVATFDESNSTLPSERTRCALESKSGEVYIGTNSGVAVIKDLKIVDEYTAEDGVDNPYVLCLEQDKDGNIYVGSDGGGIFKFTDGVRTGAYTTNEGLGSGVILRMSYDADKDCMWVSDGDSFMRWDFEQFQRVPGNASSSVFDFKIYENDMIVLASEGIYFYDRAALDDPDTATAYRVLDKADGLSSYVTANSWSYVDEDGKIWLSCSKGAFILDSQNLYINSTKPVVSISKAVVDDEVMLMPSKIHLKSDSTRLTLNCAILTNNAHSNAKIEYILEGFDEKPIELSPSDDMRISYTNLKGGTYKFKLRGYNNDGVVSDELIIEVTKDYKALEHTAVWVLLVIAAVFLIIAIAFYISNFRTRRLNEQKEEYRTITEQAMLAIADTIDAKDSYTAGHSKRVAKYSVEIGKHLGFNEEQLQDLYYTSLLHDIGKIGVEDEILNKPSKLTDEEFAKIKNHTTIGNDILSSITVIDGIAVGAKYHHERYDGNGYPSGLKGEEIPLIARIICVADSYDAMNTNRPYREKLPEVKILKELIENCDKQFDRKVVDAFLQCMDE